MKLELPDFKCTEDAIRFGQCITRSQYIFLAGAHAALKREIDELCQPLSGNDAEALRIANRTRMNRALILAFKKQFISECLEAAPENIIASIIGLGIDTEGNGETEVHKASQAVSCGVTNSSATPLPSLPVKKYAGEFGGFDSEGGYL